jgi:hypothetical protein
LRIAQIGKTSCSTLASPHTQITIVYESLKLFKTPRRLGFSAPASQQTPSSRLYTHLKQKRTKCIQQNLVTGKIYFEINTDDGIHQGPESKLISLISV